MSEFERKAFLVPPDHDPSRTELELSYRMKHLEERVADSAVHFDKRFDQIQHTIDSLSFVPRGEYLIEMKAMSDKVEAANRIAWWALGAVVSGVLIAILVALVIKMNV